jgi:hypothetical protein
MEHLIISMWEVYYVRSSLHVIWHFDIPIIVALKRKLLIDSGVIRFFCNYTMY